LASTAASQDPMVQGRRLRSELRRARQAANLTQKDVADALEWSTSKLIRIERGPVGISITDLRALLQHYQIDDKKRVDELVEMARISKRPAWWTKYKHIMDSQFIALLGYEASATIIRQYHGGLVPGLLQTEDYAREVTKAYTADKSLIEDGVSSRLERQQLLERDDPPAAHFILDEAVIRRVVGGRKIMREQLEHLDELNTRPNLSIQVLPFSLGAHAGMPAPFAIYEFPPEEDEDYIVLLENLGGNIVVRNENGEASAYLDRFTELAAQATDANRLHQVLDEAVNGFDPQPSSGPAGARGLSKRQKETDG
jgi:transcriptional regulator with XRE-family HTH domain